MGKFELAWLDSFHTGTAIMLSDGPGTNERISVLGSNRARSGEPLGLRREMGTFLISHCGIFAEPNTRREIRNVPISLGR